MPKKAKTPKKITDDFFFLTSMSVFAALTIFAAQYMIDAKSEALEAQKRRELPVAQLELVEPSPTPSPTPLSLKPTPRPTAYPKTTPLELKVTE